MPLTPVTWLDDFIVNLTTDGVQNAPRIVHLSNGNILVVWASLQDAGVGDPPFSDVIGQLFNPLGERIGGEFIVNGFTSFTEASPDVAALSGGSFLTVFTLANNGTQSIILTQRDATGELLGSTIIADDAAVGTSPTYFDPRVVVHSDTSALILYRITEGNGDSDIRGVIYNSQTQSIGVELNILPLEGVHEQPEVALLDNGNYVVVAKRTIVGQEPTIVYAIVDADGVAVLDETTIVETTFTNSTENQPSVTALTGGGFVVSWTNTDLVDTDVVVQIFDNDGQTVDGNLNVNGDGLSNNNSDSAVVAMSGGNFFNGIFRSDFVVFYVNDVSNQIEGQRYNALGIEVGDVFTVSTDAGANSIDAERLADGRIAVSFQDGSGEARMEIIDPRDEVNAPAYGPGSWQIGTTGDDILDRLVFGADNMAGGAGNDTLSVSTPEASYYGGSGDDTFIVQSPLTLSDHLDGGTGRDTLDLADRSEDYVIDLSQDRLFFGAGFASIETISFENVTGTSGNNTIVGTDGANRLDGFEGDDTILGEGGNDTLIGGDGNDTLTGGTGRDRLFGGNDDDRLIADGDGGTYNAGAGNDTILLTSEGGPSVLGGTGLDALILDLEVPINIDLATGVFNTTGRLSGIEAVVMGQNPNAGRISGSDNNETISGGFGDDSLSGQGGDDTLFGSDGDDRLFGGNGNDALLGDSGNNTLSGGEGDDVLSGTTGTSRLSGDAGNDFLFGSSGTDTLFGGTGADQIEGDGGADLLFGGTGRDILSGGNGNDTLTADGDGGIYDAGANNDVVIVLALGAQTTEGGTGFDVLDMTNLNASIFLDLELGGSNIAGRHSGFESVSMGSGADTVSGSGISETISGGVGDDSLAGLNGNDVLRGDSGKDTLSGLVGNDNLFGGTENDELSGGSGSDTLFGGTGDDVLSDDDGRNTLNGEDGHDLLQGGSGIDLIDGGAGNDTLFGGAGADSMVGGTGSDVFIIDATGDRIIELADGGARDIVSAAVTFTLGAGVAVEVLTAFDITASDLIDLTGNTLAQRITGNVAANRLSDGGGAGADSLIGLAGNDTYIVRNAATTIAEGAGQGAADRVLAGVSFTLAADDRIESLATITAGATTAIDLTGNAGDQRITGNAGANAINGKGGTDILTGGTGADHFMFDTVLGRGNIDIITDFRVPADTIDLDNAIFDTLRNGDLRAAAFHSGTSGRAADASDRIIYDTDSGALFYDRNGDASGGRVRFATLDAGLSLTHQDFLIL